MFPRIGFLCALSSFFACILAHNTNDQTGSNVDYGSFSDPSVYVRPRFRYWVPDASIDLGVVTDDFALAKDVGMGGLELLGYYLYGDYPSVIAEGGPVPVDWATYGWGTPAWKNLMTVALQAAKQNGMIMDFANGPNQGAGVPAKPDDDGLMWDLIPYNKSVAIGGTFDSVLPGWGSGEFVSASTALVISSEKANLSALPAWQGPYYYEGSTQTLDAPSLEDVTSKVKANGQLTLKFPSNAQGMHYEVFAFYQNHSDYLEQASPFDLNTTIQQSAVTSYVNNGSWVVDHFSSKGAQVIIDFWEQNLLDNTTLQLLQEVGNYGWEDSMEFGAGALAWWTPNLLNTFKSNRGYALNKYLPLIYQYNTEANGPLASPDRFSLNSGDQGQSHVNDYWQTLTELNQVYLKTLTNWTMESLKSQFSAQVGYNLPMDMLANIPSVNAPECESLGFNHIIDAYRQFSGPANLAGKRVISSELGAQRDEVYSQTMPELIWDTKRSVAGGINQFVYHGYPFTGNYPNTTWPGFTTFTYRFSSMHGPRQPAWEYYKDFMDWTARTQWVAQRGVPKVDLAFYLKKDQYFTVPSVYEPNDLAQAGYTYEYLSPDNFMLPDAVVSNGVLAPDRQAFKAMILRGNDSLTVSGVQKIVEFAHAGLPIVFTGGMPTNLTGYNITGTKYVQKLLDDITHLDNVYNVPEDNLGAHLSAIGITPRTTVGADRIWYTYWRESTDHSRSFIYIYNDAWDSALGEGSSSGTILFQTTGVPYMYDAWTGERTPILAYFQTKKATLIPLALAGNQSIIIGFHNDEKTPSGTRLLAIPSTVYSATETNGIITLKASNSSEPALLSNGTIFNLPIPAPPISLENWGLTIESWTRPLQPGIDQTISIKHNTTYNITTLQPWNQIDPSLRHVSGRGFYGTMFSWPPSHGEADGAILDLGVIVNTARVWLNGHQLPPLDPTDAWTDVGEYLMHGTNTIVIVVSTTLGNALIPIFDEDPALFKTSGTIWLGPRPIEQEYGLVVPVRLVPYRTSTINTR